MVILTALGNDSILIYRILLTTTVQFESKIISYICPHWQCPEIQPHRKMRTRLPFSKGSFAWAAWRPNKPWSLPRHSRRISQDIRPSSRSWEYCCHYLICHQKKAFLFLYRFWTRIPLPENGLSARGFDQQISEKVTNINQESLETTFSIIAEVS
jgi:hypothetical protein